MFEIETARCLIRPWQKNSRELDALIRWTGNLDMMRYVSGSIWTDADREKFFDRQAACLDAAGVCFGVAALKESGEIVGVAGGAPLELVDDWQIGWWVDPAWQGRGLGSEFANALIEYMLDHVQRPRVLAVIKPENVASRRVAEKAGMKEIDTVPAHTLESRWQDEAVTLYAAGAEPGAC